MASINIIAPAKINLFLHVTGKRDDLPTPERSPSTTSGGHKSQDGFAQAGGYHLLESLVAFTEFGDTLEIRPAETLTLEIGGPLADSCRCGDDNLVMKAARILGHPAGAHMALEKHIPVGAGLGGGSSDAAATLLGLKKLWNLTIDDAALRDMALRLGSDVPVCLAKHAAWMSGVGEHIAPVRMQADAWVALVNPGVPLLTKDVFRHFSGKFMPSIEMSTTIDSFDGLLRYILPKHNALEASAIALAPVIKTVLDTIANTPGCHLSRMSGSGATCFGLYESEAAARQAAKEIANHNPAWWSVVTKLRS